MAYMDKPACLAIFFKMGGRLVRPPICYFNKKVTTCLQQCVFGIVVGFVVVIYKNSLIKSSFCEIDFKKNWCLVKIVVEVVDFKKTISCIWLKKCG